MKIRSKILAAITLSIVAAVGSKAQTPRINFSEYDLPNGLHVILQPDKSSPSVVVSVMYHVGSKNENPTRTGFAHFFEHLMFEGTPNIPRGEYGKIVEKAGGTLNANTSMDRTYYFELLPPNQLELGLWLESDRMFELKVDSIGIETQRGVVKEEKRQRVDNQPYGNFMAEAFKRAFTVHPYHWVPIGDFEHLNKASYSEFADFYKTYYVPNNAVLTLSGNFDPAQAKTLVEKYFAPIARGTREMFRPTVVEPEKTKEITDTIYDNIQLPGVFLTYNTPAVGTPDFYAVDMFTTLLAGGQSSYLYKSLVDQKQKALEVEAFPFDNEHPGVSIILALANMNNSPVEIKNDIDSIITQFQTNLIGEKDFKKLQNIYENRIISGLGTAAQRAENLATAYTYFKNTEMANKEGENYMKVTREDLRRVAQKYFRTTNRVTLYYLPKPKTSDTAQK
jgi:predicted Zn-dependent peptidase